MEKICSHKRVSQIITGDPVRPHINAETRLAPGRDVFHIDDMAYLCMVYLDRVPADEDCLLSANCGPSCSCIYSMVTGKRIWKEDHNG